MIREAFNAVLDQFNRLTQLPYSTGETKSPTSFIADGQCLIHALAS